MSQNLRDGLWRRRLRLWARIPRGFCGRVKPDTGEHAKCPIEGANHKDSTLTKNLLLHKLENV